jgi:hypothetical protein
MADEITVYTSLRLDNLAVQRGPYQRTVTATQSTARANGPATWAVGFAAEEDYSFGDVTPGYIELFNADSTNYVDVGMSDGGTMKALIRLMPGDVAVFRIKPSTTLRGQANTAAVNVEVTAFNT